MEQLEMEETKVLTLKMLKKDIEQLNEKIKSIEQKLMLLEKVIVGR